MIASAAKRVFTFVSLASSLASGCRRAVDIALDAGIIAQDPDAAVGAGADAASTVGDPAVPACDAALLTDGGLTWGAWGLTVRVVAPNRRLGRYVERLAGTWVTHFSLNAQGIGFFATDLPISVAPAPGGGGGKGR